MQPGYPRIWPFLIAALVVYLVYCRLRRTFGRQPLHRVRMGLKVGLLLVLAVSMLPRTRDDIEFLGVVIAGVLLGLALAVWGAARTRFQMHDGRMQYLPHTRTGIAVSLLFLGRLAYRIVEIYLGGPMPLGSDAVPGQGFAPSSMVGSRFNAGLLFVLIGYYVCYYGLVLWKSKHLSVEDLEASSPAVS